MNRLLGSVCLLLLLISMAPAQAQTSIRARPVAVPIAPVAPIAPVVPATTATPADAAVTPDYKAELEKARARNKQLRSENESLHAQLAQWTSKGGSLVHAYCETATLSANSAGERNDCAATGYTCERVSGLCRTSAVNSSQCAAGRIWCVYGNRCVTSAKDCQP